MVHFFTRLYPVLVKANIAILFAYRWTIVQNIFSTFLWVGFSIGSVFLLTLRSDGLYGWTGEGLIVLISTYSVVVGVFYAFFSKNFQEFATYMNEGKLDNILLKPLDSQVFISSHYISVTAFFRTILGLAITWYILIVHMGVVITPLMVLWYGVCVLLGVSILYALWYSVCTITIWYPKLSNLVDLLYNLNGALRFPVDLYTNSAYFVLWMLVPLTFAMTVPTKALLGTMTPGDMILFLVIVCVLLTITRLFWLYALRHYTSASS